jgi:uncharacterized protein
MIEELTVITPSRELQPIHRVFEGKFNTFTGIQVNIHRPTPEMIQVEDICKGLSNICRFGGQIGPHYTVAEHTLLVWYLAPREHKRAALVHDMAEAYIGDVIKPLKVMLGAPYAQIERRFEEVIFAKFGVNHSDVVAIKPYDMEALEIEHNYFRCGSSRFTQIFYSINNEVGWKSPYEQLMRVIEDEFRTLSIAAS